jgi:hypothetical protein
LISPIAGKYYHSGTLDYTLFWEGLALVHEALKNKDETLAAWRRWLAETESPQKSVEIQRRIDALDKSKFLP